MAKLRIDKAKLDKAITRSFDSVVAKVSDAMDEAIASDVWDYPRQTKRRNGELAGSPRSIVDTGELLDSKVISRSSVGNAVEFSWEAPHSLYAHEGYTTKSGLDVPKRDWTRLGLEIANPLATFEAELRRNL